MEDVRIVPQRICIDTEVLPSQVHATNAPETVFATEMPIHSSCVVHGELKDGVFTCSCCADDICLTSLFVGNQDAEDFDNDDDDREGDQKKSVADKGT
eukprot:6473599-Amphidinium_carterae.1